VNCLFADFVRGGEQIVKDYDSGLMWTDHEVLSKSWVEGITYCEDLLLIGDYQIFKNYYHFPEEKKF
jgi:hypothetical protein